MPLYDFSCPSGHRFERFIPLARFDEPQSCDCGAHASRMLCAPAIVSDTIAPRYGADGKLYDSMQDWRRSLEPENNPRGEKFHELAPGEKLPEFKAAKFDRAKRREDIKRTINDAKYGNLEPAKIVYGDAPL